MKKSIFVVLVLIVIVLIGLVFVSCDDTEKDRDIDANACINFEGMTREEIIKMADDGKITSLTIVAIYKGDRENCDLFAYDNKGYYLREIADGTLEREHYFFNIDSDGYEYIINITHCDYDNSKLCDIPKVEYIKHKPSITKEYTVSEIFKDSVIVDYRIDGEKLIFMDNENDLDYMYKVNASEWTLPEEFSNYKELAVED